MSRGGDKIRQGLLEMGQPLPPEAVAPKGRASMWTQLALKCFWDCNTERSFGFGVGPIPWSKIVQWVDRHAPARHRNAMVDIVRQLDAKYLELEVARAEAERKRG